MSVCARPGIDGVDGMHRLVLALIIENGFYP